MYLTKKIIPLIIVLIFISIIGLSGCQTTDSPGTGVDLLTAKAIVYGKVMTSDSSGVYPSEVQLYNPWFKCDADLDDIEVQAHPFTERSGKYRTVFHISPMKDTCLVARVKLPDSSHFEAPEAKSFDVEFHKEWPLDSVRVDFTVHDSTKQAVQDSTKQ